VAFLVNHWGDVCSALGVVIAIGGFAATLRQIRKSKSAAEAARESAERTRQRIEQNLAIEDISMAMQVMEEVKRLQRDGTWKTAVERYSTLVRLLAKVKGEYPNLSNRAKDRLGETIARMSTNESNIEKRLAKRQEATLDVARLNKIVSDSLVDLGEVDLETKG
jgi:hypothetical protein